MKRSVKLTIIFILLTLLSATTLLTLGSCGVIVLASKVASRDKEIVVDGAHIWVMPLRDKAAFMYFDADLSLNEGELQICEIPEIVTYRGNEYKVTSIGSTEQFEVEEIVQGDAQIGELIIPDWVDTINLNCYRDLDTLKSINVSRGNSIYSSKEGVLYCNSDSRYSNDCNLLYYPLGKKDDTVRFPRNLGKIYSESHIWENEYVQDFTFENVGWNYVSINGALYSLSGETLMYYPVNKQDTTFVAPKEMRSISQNSHFWDNKNIQNVEVEQDSRYLKVEDNVLYSNDGRELLFRPNCGKTYFSIPSSVSVVHYGALMGLTHLFVPKSVVVFLDVFDDREVYLLDISHIYFESEILPKYLCNVKFTVQQINFGYTSERFDEIVGNL